MSFLSDLGKALLSTGNAIKEKTDEISEFKQKCRTMNDSELFRYAKHDNLKGAAARLELKDNRGYSIDEIKERIK